MALLRVGAVPQTCFLRLVVHRTFSLASFHQFRLLPFPPLARACFLLSLLLRRCLKAFVLSSASALYSASSFRSCSEGRRVRGRGGRAEARQGVGAGGRAEARQRGGERAVVVILPRQGGAVPPTSPLSL